MSENNAPAPKPAPKDTAVSEMTDREIAEETLIILRAGKDAVERMGPMLDGLKDNPMLRALGVGR